MDSKIAQALRLKFSPIVLLWSDEKPKEAMEFKEGKWGCEMFLYANALRGGISAASKDTYGCWGGGVGLGFGNQYEHFPGGIEGFCYFLSIGNKYSKSTQKISQQLKAQDHFSFAHDFVEGERYVKTPQLVQSFVDNLPIMNIPNRYVIMKSLEHLKPDENPVLISFLVDANQLSALVILSNYDRSDFSGAIIPYAAGCQTLGIFTYRECLREKPSCIVGFTDISARKYIKNVVGDDYLMFNVCWKRFLELENYVAESFLEQDLWQSLIAKS